MPLLVHSQAAWLIYRLMLVGVLPMQTPVCPLRIAHAGVSQQAQNGSNEWAFSVKAGLQLTTRPDSRLISQEDIQIVRHI